MTTSLRDFFLDYEPQDGISSPADYAYLIMLRHLLSVISSWPLVSLDPLDTGALQRRKIWVTIQRSFHMFVCLITTVGGITYVILHKKSMTFFELGHLYISLLMTTVIFSRITTLCFSDEYVVVARDFLEKMHLFFYKDRSEYSLKIVIGSVLRNLGAVLPWKQTTTRPLPPAVSILTNIVNKKTHKLVHRISHLFTLYLICQMLAGLFLFNVTPMFNNYSAGNYARGGLKGNATYEHALYFSYPFPASTDLKWYILANIFHWIISYLCATWFCMHDCFLSLMVFHIWGHFKILLYNLDNFPRPSSKTSFMLEDSVATLTYEMYSPNELKGVSIQLNELIEYHRNIVNFTDKISEVFGPMLFAYYGFHQASGCLLLLECSQMTAAALIRYLPLTIIMFQQLIQLSIIFELIGSISLDGLDSQLDPLRGAALEFLETGQFVIFLQSDRLKDAVYGLPWESMDTKNRRTVAFFLMNVQEPVHVKALGLADVGVTSMTTILKTSMSYFTFLNSM